MSPEASPEFLSREIVDAIHEEQLALHGGSPGLRDENGLESAIAAAQNVYYHGGGDLFQIAAAYAYHLVESQAYLDGNKRTGVQAALVFLEGNGVDARGLSDDATYAAMIKIACHEMTRDELANFFRSAL